MKDINNKLHFLYIRRSSLFRIAESALPQKRRKGSYHPNAFALSIHLPCALSTCSMTSRAQP